VIGLVLLCAFALVVAATSGSSPYSTASAAGGGGVISLGAVDGNTIQVNVGAPNDPYVGFNLHIHVDVGEGVNLTSIDGGSTETVLSVTPDGSDIICASGLTIPDRLFGCTGLADQAITTGGLLATFTLNATGNGCIQVHLVAVSDGTVGASILDTYTIDATTSTAQSNDVSVAPSNVVIGSGSASDCLAIVPATPTGTRTSTPTITPTSTPTDLPTSTPCPASCPTPIASNRVFGQSAFTTDACNSGGRDGSGLCFPTGVAVDDHGRLYIADYANSRVLEYDHPLVDVAPTRVFGQPNFGAVSCNSGGDYPSARSLCMPSGVAVDDAGHLYIADYGNHRVLEYDHPLASPIADRVFGQPTFNTRSCNPGGVSARGLCYPDAVALDLNGRLFVSDNANSRVLIYARPRRSSAPDEVIGQRGFTTGGCDGSAINAATLCNPAGITLDSSGRLYVADAGSGRVLAYDRPRTGAMASRVFGQSDFATASCDHGGISASTLCSPRGVTIDSRGHLYITDYVDNRVLEYSRPLFSSTANQVFGQPDFTTSSCNMGGVGEMTLCHPSGDAVDQAGHLYVADFYNSRVVEYARCGAIGNLRGADCRPAFR
jgi:sugar lactone lactonase YvrE